MALRILLNEVKVPCSGLCEGERVVKDATFRRSCAKTQSVREVEN